MLSAKQNAVGSDGQYPLSGSKPSHSRADVLCSWKDFCPPVWSEMCFSIPGTESREGVLLCLGEQFLFFFFYFLPHFFPRAQHQLSQTLTGIRGQGKSSISTPNRKQAGLPILCHCGLQGLLACRITSRSPYSSHLNSHLFGVMSDKKYAKGLFPCASPRT